MPFLGWGILEGTSSRHRYNITTSDATTGCTASTVTMDWGSQYYTTNQIIQTVAYPNVWPWPPGLDPVIQPTIDNDVWLSVYPIEPRPPIRRRTPEQRAEERRLMEAERIREEQLTAARHDQMLARNLKATQLLRDVLGEHDFKLFKDRGYIDVPSPSVPSRVYRIRPNQMIQVMESDRFKESLCIHPSESFAPNDVVAGQVLMAKLDESRLLMTANHHRIAVAGRA